MADYVTADYRPYDPTWRATHGYPPLAPGNNGFYEDSTDRTLGLPDPVRSIGAPIGTPTRRPIDTELMPGGRTGTSLTGSLNPGDQYSVRPDEVQVNAVPTGYAPNQQGDMPAALSAPDAETAARWTTLLQQGRAFEDPALMEQMNRQGTERGLQNDRRIAELDAERKKHTQMIQLAMAAIGGAGGLSGAAEGGLGSEAGVIGEGSASTAATGVTPAATQGFIGSDIAAGGAASGTDFFNNMGVDEFGNPTQGNFQGGPGTPGSGDFFNPGGTSGGLPAAPPGATPGATSIPPGALSALQKVFGPGIMGAIGNNPALAAALAAGVLEKSNNPLTQPTIDAIKGAIASGQSIQGMQIPGITPSLQRAIDTANTNVGAWKPALDQAGAFTSSGGAPITAADTARYMNPYIDQALAPAARKISEAAAAQRMSDAAKAGSRGAFGTERNDQIASLTNRNELMATGDLYGTGYANAFNTALNTAGADKSRALTAGGAFGNLATTTSALGGKDVEGLTSAGGIESLPFTEELTKQKTAGDVLSGAGNAGARAIGSTGQPSLLTNLTGAAGVLGAFDKLGNPSTPSTPSIPSLPNMQTLPSFANTSPVSAPSNPFDDSNAGVFGS